MSFERAYKNCKICYTNVKACGYSYCKQKDELVLSDYVTRAMNEAMKALEDTVRNMFPFWMDAGCCKEEMELAQKALKACAKCDFKHAGIADLLEEEMPEVFCEGEEEEQK